MPVPGEDNMYYTIEAWCQLHHWRMNNVQKISLGRRATRISKLCGYDKYMVLNAKYNKVGSYHIEVLQQLIRPSPRPYSKSTQNNLFD